MARKSKLKKVYKVECEDGYFLFKLNSVLEEKNISKNSVVVRKNIDFNTIQRLIKGNLTRIDLGTIAKLCNDLDCSMGDIIEYINNSKKGSN